VDPAHVENQQPAAISHTFNAQHPPPREKATRCFHIIMSDEFEEYIDWSKGDLLDACNDPAIGGMDLGR
jgi:hypothetical protein